MSESTWWGEDIIPRIRWRKRIEDGRTIPDGYGVAYHEWHSRHTVCMPLPLNVIVGWARWFYIEVRHGFRLRPDRFVDAVETARSVARTRGYALGERDGYERGYATGLRHAAIAREATP